MKLSTMRLMRVLAALAALSLFAAACGSDATDDGAVGTDDTTADTTATDDTTAETTAPDDGLFEISYQIAEPVSIDSVNVQESEGFEVARLLYDGLTDLAPDLSAVPAVALSWDSPDNIVWTFTLRDDVTFHDGTPVTATSFVNSFNRVANPENLSDVAYYGSYITGITGWADVEAGEATEVTGVVAVDDTTLEITLEGPYPLLPKAMAHPVFSPVSDATLAAPSAEAPIGNGPYMMDGDWEHDISIRIVKNDAYYGEAGTPDAINFQIFDDIATAYLEVQAGNLDISSVPPEKISTAESDFPGNFISVDTGSYTYLGFPTTVAPFDNADIRKALSLAIDREAIADIVYEGTRAPANGFAPPLAPGATASCTNCNYDPEAALELFEAAGGIDGPVNVYFNAGSGHEGWIEAVANNWKQTLGVEVTFVGQEWPEHIGLLQEYAHDGPFRLGWLWDLPSAENFLSPLFLAGSSDNYASYDNPDFDQAIADFKAAPSEEEGNAFLATAQDILNDDMPVAPIVFGKAQIIYGDGVSNVNYTVFGYTELENVQPG